jgi:hypothetical protein
MNICTIIIALCVSGPIDTCSAEHTTKISVVIENITESDCVKSVNSVYETYKKASKIEQKSVKIIQTKIEKQL